ncbi:MAG: TetR/AcrR family transcriptional regulator [Hamadaea sp.]|nr:TetR/AcrR family transcriptional regulator [Hamadaea sp.]
MKTSALRDHTAKMIMERAAELLAERGDAASMADIADAAGVGRATLYRYFPSRDALLQAMADAALEELSTRLAEAQLDAVDIREGLARLTRAFVATGGKYVALMRTGHKPLNTADVRRRIGEPLMDLFRRGIATGHLRDDLSEETLLGLFSGLLEAGIALSAQPGHGAEQASAAVTSVFLTGAGRAAAGPR